MGFTSLQVCMDSPDWLQGTINGEYGMDSSSSPSGGDMLTCSRPLIESRRLGPPHDQALKCPRCDSTHTKFCYYNNYSLTQPRYFCKTCRRYWTKGGTLRNIPVGGGCRKNKKVSSKNIRSPNDQQLPSSSSSVNHNGTVTDLHLSSFPDHQLIPFPHHNMANMFHHHENNLPMTSRPIDFMESKLEAIVGNSRNYDFMGEFGTHNFGSPFGMTSSVSHHDDNHANIMDTTSNYQRLTLLPSYNDHDSAIDVKPNTKHLEWQQQQEQGKDLNSFGYLGSTWSSGIINGYGTSATNPLI